MASHGAPERAAVRQQVLLQHLTPGQGPVALPTSVGDSAAYERCIGAADDVVVVAALRSPLTKARRGMLKDTSADDLLAAVLEAVLQKTGVNPADVGDVVVGSVLGPSSQRANEARIALFLAGFPDIVPVRTVNRQCSSGLQAVADVAAGIKAGYYDIGIAGGVETMSRNPMAWEGGINPRVKDVPQAKSCLMPMGITSENVAAKYGIAREVQDRFAALSHVRAHAAQQAGKFVSEIVPIRTKVKDENGKEHEVTVTVDDGVRPETTAASLGKLKPAFSERGTTTAGNSSQVTDGAAAVMLMRRAEAVRRGLPILGVFRTAAVVGVDPAVMGIGPAVAIPAAVQKAGLQLSDIDVYEINEAFASQATYCVEHLGLDPQKVNPNGGAIALGHPLGCTGARQVATLLHEMGRRGNAARFGVVSMCIGSGMGMAAVFEAGPTVDPLRNARPTTHHAHLSRDAA